MSEGRLEKIISSYIPMPVCIINRLGKVVEANSRIGEVFLYDGIGGGDIFALTGIRAADLYDAAEKDQQPLLIRKDMSHGLNSSIWIVSSPINLIFLTRSAMWRPVQIFLPA